METPQTLQLSKWLQDCVAAAVAVDVVVAVAVDVAAVVGGRGHASWRPL